MRFFILSALLFCVSFVHAAAVPADSIGMEKIDGKVFVLHQVEQKETLYSLSKRYGVKVADITQVNPESEDGLSIGQILRIPVPAGMPAEDGRVIHTVQPKETLYSIAREYKVNVEDIKKWNNMSMNLLDIGQKIRIYPEGIKENTGPDIPERTTYEVENVTRHKVQAGETLYSISRKFNASLEDLRAWNGLQYNDISIGQELIVSKRKETIQPPVEVPAVVRDATVSAAADQPAEVTDAGREPAAADAQPATENNADSGREVSYNMEEDKPFERENTNFVEVEEDGLAELIDGSGNNRKYLALHRTAPIGTIMRVRNEMNSQEVFVRIIGRLPDTGTNRNVLLKISKAAYEQLGAIDNRFRVRISYIP